MNFSSKLLEQAVAEMSQLPGVGKRTALRLVLHLLKQPESQTEQFTKALLDLRSNIKLCRNCHNISVTEICEICAFPNQVREDVCGVDDIRDVLAIASTAQYRSHDQVYGGQTNPSDGYLSDSLNYRT